MGNGGDVLPTAAVAVPESLAAPASSAPGSDGHVRVREDAFPALEAAAQAIIRGKHRFERLVVDAAFAAGIMADNPLKLRMLDTIQRRGDSTITLYRCGPFVDLCRGPHVPHTGVFKSFKLYRANASHWTMPPLTAGAADTAASHGGGGGAQAAPTSMEVLLQRVYGVAFPTKTGAAEWEARQEAARQRDHRVIGRAQSLFAFHDLAPGSAFLLPAGTRVYNKVRAAYGDQART